MFLAVLPLFLAWRSLASYFYCAAFPLFVLMAAKIPANKAAQPRAPEYARSHKITPAAQTLAGTFPPVPEAVGIRAFAFPSHIFRYFAPPHS